MAQTASAKEHIVILLRPVDDSVSLGEDLAVRLSSSTTLQQLRRCIYDLKGIPSRRQRLCFENGNEVPERMESWALRRIGLNDYSVVIVSPVRPGMWLWYPLEHYRMQVLKLVLEYLDGKGSFEVELKDVERAVPIPPMVPDSMLILLRQYPDLVDLFPDDSRGKMYVHKAAIFNEIRNSKSNELEELLTQANTEKLEAKEC